MSALPMSNARREKQQKARVSTALSAATTGGEDARRKAVMNVVQVWLDRLQLISTITTFFAGIDGTILSFALSLTHASDTDYHHWSNTLRLLTASLTGALIFHVCAAMTSFVASFALIRYRLIDMKDHLREEGETASPASESFEKEKTNTAMYESAAGKDSAAGHSKDATHVNGVQSLPLGLPDLLDLVQNVTSTVSELEGRVFIQVQPHIFNCLRGRRDKNESNGMHLDPPIRLLSRCHSLSVTMALLGFILALLGILTFAWTALPRSVGIFASVVLGGCVSTVVLILNSS